MICNMDRRVAGFVGLLGLAVSATSRPAFAQQAGSNWFDDSAPSAPAAPPSAAPAPSDETAPQPPSFGPQGQPMSPDQGAPQAGMPQAPPDNAPETDPRALSEFRPTLDPYGTWVEDEKYGTVWVPNREAVGDDFAPYVSSGHWALTEDGDWSWQSDYPFGGVVFHYGRWVWVPGTGWAWVAGRRYANAWVTWRVPTDDYAYFGWAPMPPAWGWYGGSAISLWWYPPAPYVFCPSGYAFSYNVHSYIVHDRYVVHDIAGHTRNYSPGSAGGHLAATPRVLPANSVAPRGPTLQSAHIPATAAPMNRSAGSAFSGERGSQTPYRSGSGYAAGRPANPSSFNGARAYSNPSGYARPSSYVNPSYSRPSSYSAYRPSSASVAPPASRSYYSSPSSSPRSYYSSPSSSPRSYYSSPSSSPRSYSAPISRSYSAPAMHYSAPARSYSAPARSYSAPSRSAPSSSHSRR
jgi:hypothetical protein